MNWNDTDDIVRALNTYYPDVSACKITEAELIEKVLALPGFNGEKQPPADAYKNIIFPWSLSKANKNLGHDTSVNNTFAALDYHYGE